MSKIIKDSVHGYIEIEDAFLPVIDSPEFQRLRFIEQDSFRVLYPGARHDRFIHSLGVYCLAKRFAESFEQNIKEDLNNFDIDNYKTILEQCKITFRYAALMHDIGHAPFSHTTEDFFKLSVEQDGTIKIDSDLINAVKDYNSSTIFESDFSECTPASHEKISALFAIRYKKILLQEVQKQIDFELAARMITGVTYSYNGLSDTEKSEYGIKNCFIRLLNSDTADVDKLDYQRRDTMMSGYNNVSVDIDRIAMSVTAAQTSNGLYPAFRKSALSVIENVFRSKSEQGNWIISHPVVKYDSALLQACIRELLKTTKEDTVTDCYKDERLKTFFNSDIFTKKGLHFEDKNICLLNDSYFINRFSEEADFENINIFAEFFDRSSRYKPVWKSYYEYRNLLNIGDNKGKGESIFLEFKPLIDIVNTKNLFRLDKKVLQEIIDDENNPEKVKGVATKIIEFSNKQEIECSFVILSSDTSFSPKINADNIHIVFNKMGKSQNTTYAELKPKTQSEKPDNYFYFYSKERFTEDMLKSFIETFAVSPRA